MLNLSDPNNSNTYNPLLFGSVPSKAARLVNLIPDTSGNAGADFYTQAVNAAFTNIFLGLDGMKRAYTFEDINVLLNNGEALASLMNQVSNPKDKVSIDTFLNNYKRSKKVNDEWVEVISSDDLKRQLGGISGRITTFATGSMGKIFNVYNPEIQLLDTMKEGKSLYVMLPTMDQSYPSEIIAKMIISDLRSATAALQELPKHQRPRVPFQVFLDEFGSYATEASRELFTQGRSAGLAMIPALQDFSQLNRVSPEFAQTIIQNTYTKVFFNFKDPTNAESAADIIGKVLKTTKTITQSKGSSSGSSGDDVVDYREKATENNGISIALREAEEHIVSAETLACLPIGQCIVKSGEGRVFHLTTEFIDAHIDGIEFKKNAFTPPDNGLKPLNLGEVALSGLDVATSENAPAPTSTEKDDPHKDARQAFFAYALTTHNPPNKKVLTEVFNHVARGAKEKIQLFSKYRDKPHWQAFLLLTEADTEFREKANAYRQSIQDQIQKNDASKYTPL